LVSSRQKLTRVNYALQTLQSTQNRLDKEVSAIEIIGNPVGFAACRLARYEAVNMP